MSEGNIFGGKNPNGLYIPLTDVEREASARAAERGVVVHVKGWGTYPATMAIGEYRVGVDFALTCPPDKPEGMEVRDLAIQVSTTDGIPLFATTQSVRHGAAYAHLRPQQVLGLTLEIAVHHCDPEIVKQLTGATGLTSRRVDPDTGRWGGPGNMSLSDEQKAALASINDPLPTRF